MIFRRLLAHRGLGSIVDQQEDNKSDIFTMIGTFACKSLSGFPFAGRFACTQVSDMGRWAKTSGASIRSNTESKELCFTIARYKVINGKSLSNSQPKKNRRGGFKYPKSFTNKSGCYSYFSR